VALPRRAALGALLATAACAGGGEEPPPMPAGPPSYSHLLPLRLLVGRVEFQPATDPARRRRSTPPMSSGSWRRTGSPPPAGRGWRGSAC